MLQQPLKFAAQEILQDVPKAHALYLELVNKRK